MPVSPALAAESFRAVGLKGPRGGTVKHRMAYDPARRDELSEPALAFLRESLERCYGRAPDGKLRPALAVAYTRVTLAAPALGERLTCDFDLAFSAPDGASGRLAADRVIVESKSAHGNATTDRALRALGARPEDGCSKYCLGVGFTNPHVNSNRLRPGALKRELTKYLRTGRALRKPGRATGQRKNRIPDMVNIAERPAEADDRAVPGHWEGDLVIGKRNATAIGTLVERTTGFAMLVALPDGYKPEHVAPALAAKIQTLPDALRRSLTWDQGPEMRDWKQVHVDAGIDVFFCDPHAPWQRGSNENTNGLLRQYWPKGTDFSAVTETELDAVADELNDRPRKRLDFANPTEQLAELLLQ